MDAGVAFLAEGKLYLTGSMAPGGGEGLPSPVESPFALELMDQAARTLEKNQWKLRSETGRLMAGGAAWAAATPDASVRPIRFTGVTRAAEPGVFYYTLLTDAVGGLFRYDARAGEETRLFHRNGFRATDLCYCPETGRLAFSQENEDGTSSIAVTTLDGRGMNPVTEGDSRDCAPSWVPGRQNCLVYQSAGLGRDQHGALAGQGPFAVHLLDLEAGEIESLLEDARFDYLLPRMTAEGALYCLRRPYEAVRRVSHWSLLRDLLLLPVRLVWALFGFLNFFSLLFTGKPLTSAGGPQREGPQPQHLLLWGKVVEAQRAGRRSASAEPLSLVPKDWVLLRRSPDGAEQVLAAGVLSFDLRRDGGVVYTNGSGVYSLAPDGQRTLVGRGERIEVVVSGWE